MDSQAREGHSSLMTHAALSLHLANHSPKEVCCRGCVGAVADLTVAYFDTPHAIRAEGEVRCDKGQAEAGYQRRDLCEVKVGWGSCQLGVWVMGREHALSVYSPCV